MNFRTSPSSLSRRAATVVDMTALIDVVFLLLIFFVLTSSHVDQQAAEASALIDVDQAESDNKASQVPVEALIVTVSADGTIYLDDGGVGRGERGAGVCGAKKRRPDAVLRLRAEQNVAHGKVAQVMSVAHTCKLRVRMAQKAGP